MKKFGPIEIHYGKVQQKVNLKYDSWHREILSRFGSLLGENMQDFHSTVAKVSVCVCVCWGYKISSWWGTVAREVIIFIKVDRTTMLPLLLDRGT